MSKESTSQDRKIRPWMEYKLHIVVKKIATGR